MAKLENYKAKANPRNKRYAEELRKLSQKYSIVGIVDVTGLPAPQFQKIRGTMRKNGAEILIVKKNIIAFVLEELNMKHPGISGLSAKADGIVGLIFTNNNPFSMYKSAKKSKSPAPAKAGVKAPNDIIVPAGPTSFSPGPIIGELGAVKIKAGITAGKVEIKEDSIVAKEGDMITEKLASILTRLGIQPLEVGLNIKAIYEAGTIYTKDVLDVDEEQIKDDIRAEALRSLKLALGVGYMSKDNVKIFIIDGHAKATAVAYALPEECRPEGLATSSAAHAVAEASTSAPANEEKKKEASETDVGSGFANFF